jgi:hypothetical protein
MTPCEQHACFIFGNFCFEILARRLTVWTGFRFGPGDWFLDFLLGDCLSRLVSDFGQETGCPDWFQILARRLIVWNGFRFWPGDWLSGMVSDIGHVIGSLDCFQIWARRYAVWTWGYLRFS